MSYENDKYAHTRPNVGVTIAPFIYDEGVIKVLLYKRSENAEVYQGVYSLPNRFFDITEFTELEKAASYALEEKTNVSIPHMTQFHTFSGDYIDPTRITTVNSCFYSILRKSEVVTLHDEQEFETVWLPVEEVLNQKLAFNHNEVLTLAYQRLLSSAEYTTSPSLFLDEKFTISELRTVTEVLIGQKIDNSRFRDRIKKSGILIECEGEEKKGANRPAQLYSLNSEHDGYFYPKSLTKA